MTGITLLFLVLLCAASFYFGRSRVQRYYLKAPSHTKLRGKKAITKWHSRPHYYGLCAMLWTAFPAAVVYLGLSLSGEETGVAAPGAALLGVLFAGAGWFASYRFLTPKFRARNHIEAIVRSLFLASAALAIAVTVMIVGSLLFEAIRFFAKVPLLDFLLGTHWSPQMAKGENYEPGQGGFGAIPVFTGTLLITLIALAVAAPFGLLAAVFLSEYASGRVRDLAKPLLEILAGIPTVVYGYFAVVTFAPFIKELGGTLGLSVAAESALAAGAVMGVMIIPFVMSLSDDVMKAVPYSLREASLGLGATQSETIRSVVIPAALPGIMGALLLAVSRAIGETMIVVMAAGLAANLTFNPLEAVTTVTAQIVTLLVGDQAFDSPKTLAAFGLSMTLFTVTLVLNLIAMVIVKTYRERYE